jgi:WD40 repeat protein
MTISLEPKYPVLLQPKNTSIGENFSFGGKPVRASRFYNNYPCSSFSNTFSQLPSQSIEAVSWSPNGRYVSFACSELASPETTSSMTTFYYNGSTFAYAPPPSYFLPGTWNTPLVTSGSGANAYAIEWAPNGKKIAVGSNGTYKVNVYNFNEGLYQFSNILQPPKPENFSETAACTDLSWSPDGNFLAASFSEDPFVYIFKVLDNSFELFTSLDQNYSVGANSCAWSPDGRYLCVGYTKTPYIGIYEFNGSSFKKLPDPLLLPPSYVNKVCWSPDGRTLSVGHELAPYLTSYLFENKKLKPVEIFDNSEFTNVVKYSVYDISWSADGRYMATTFGSTMPRLYIYTFDGKKLEKIHHAQPSGYGSVCGWRPDGEVLICGVAYSKSAPGNAGAGPMLSLESPKSKPV